MKRILLIIVLLLLVGLAGAAQVLRPMSVANALRGTNGLLSIRPSTNQTTLVLGEETAGDTDARIATHAASWGATNNTDIFDAIGGGQWKLVSAGGSSSPPSTNSGTVVSVGGTYGAQVNIASTAEIAAALVGTNGNLTLVDGSIGTNRLSAAAFAALINRTNHTGNIGWSVVTGTPTTRSGYGITDAQPIDADLTSLAGVTWANGDFAWYDGTKLTNFLSTSAGRSLLSAASSSAARSTLGLVIGTDVQAYDADLLNLAGVPWANGDFAWFDGAKMTNFASTATGRSILSSASASAVRTLLNLVVGTDVQAFDSDLSATAGLTGTGLISRTGSGTQATRTVTGTSGRLTVTNGDGVSGNPTLDIDTNSLSASINAGAPNGAGSFLHWSRLVGVPAGFSDGTDDGAGSSPTTTRGDFIVRGASNDVRLAVGKLASFMSSDGLDPFWSTPSRMFQFFDEMIYVAVPTVSGGTVAGTTANGSGAGATLMASEAGETGIIQLNTGSTSTGNNRYQIGGNSANSVLFGSATHFAAARVKIPTASSATDRFSFRFGYYDTTSGNAVDGAYFDVTDNINSGNWVLKNYSNSTATTNATAVASVAGSWATLLVLVDSAASAAQYYVDGTLAGTVTGGLPTGAGRETRVTAIIEKTGGTAGTNSASVQLGFVWTGTIYPAER